MPRCSSVTFVRRRLGPTSAIPTPTRALRSPASVLLPAASTKLASGSRRRAGSLKSRERGPCALSRISTRPGWRCGGAWRVTASAHSHSSTRRADPSSRSACRGGYAERASCGGISSGSDGHAVPFTDTQSDDRGQRLRGGESLLTSVRDEKQQSDQHQPDPVRIDALATDALDLVDRSTLDKGMKRALKLVVEGRLSYRAIALECGYIPRERPACGSAVWPPHRTRGAPRAAPRGGSPG